MGGTVAVTVRLDEATVVADTRWTNSLPHWVRDLRFVEGARAHLQAYLDVKSEHKGRPLNAPCGYGLVVFDLPTRTILSMQDYTGFVRVVPFSLRQDIMFADAAERTRWERLLGAGRLTLVRSRWRCNGRDSESPHFERIESTQEVLSGPLKALAERLEGISREEHAPRRDPLVALHSEVIVDLAPWTILDFQETADGARALKAALDERGFTFSAAETQAWESWIRECEERQAEADAEPTA